MESTPAPPEIVRAEHLRPGFSKFFIPESGRPFHYFTEPDVGPAHNHSFGMVSHVLAGGYVEEIYTIAPDGTWRVETVARRPGTSHYIAAGTIHRILSLPLGHCFTLS